MGKFSLAALIVSAFCLPAAAGQGHPPPPPDLPFELMGADELAGLHLPPDTASHPALLKLLKSGNLHAPEGLPVKLSNVRMRPMARLPAENTTYIRSSNWSGFIVLPYPGQGPGTIEGIFGVPAFDPSDGTAVSTWVGFDGFTAGSGDVLQAGVVCIPAPYGCVAFAEYFPDFPIGLFNASSFDFIIAQVWRTGTAPHAHAVVVDGTSGDYVSFDFDCTSCSSDPWTGTSAQWIVEAPSTGTGQSIYPLSPYGIIHFSNSYTYHPITHNGGLYPGQSNNSYNVTMHDHDGNNISLSQDIDLTTFYTYRPPAGFSIP